MKKHLLLPVLLAGLSGPALAELTPYTATYRVNLDNKLNGTATASLSQQGNRFHYQLKATAPMASTLEQTDFQMENGQLKSLGYKAQRKVLFSSRINSISFDWKQRSAHAARGSKQADYRIEEGTLDPLNMEIRIRDDLLRTGRLDKEYPLADPKSFHPVRFEIIGSETLSTPMGNIDTLKVRRIHDDPERSSQFWLAKNMEYLPVKIVQTDDGAVFRLDLTGWKPVRPVRTPSEVSPAASLPVAKTPAKP